MGLFDNPGTVAIEMHFLTCISCGITFGFPADHGKRLRQTHASFYCPNGHSQAYLAKTEAEKLREDKVRLQSQLDQAQASRDAWQRKQEEAERRLRSTKGVVTGMKRRLAKGQCVRCSKSFPDLAGHMKAAHPDLRPENSHA